jgi:Domain of unknown function (DUF1330)
VSDPAPLADYVKEAAKVAAQHGGRYLVMDATPEVVEGDPGLRSVVLMEFPRRRQRPSLVRLARLPTTQGHPPPRGAKQRGADRGLNESGQETTAS